MYLKMPYVRWRPFCSGLECTVFGVDTKAIVRRHVLLCLTLKQLSIFSFKIQSHFLMFFLNKCNIWIWNWPNIINIASALRTLTTCCFSIRASVAIVQKMYLWFSRCLGVNAVIHEPWFVYVIYRVNTFPYGPTGHSPVSESNHSNWEKRQNLTRPSENDNTPQPPDQWTNSQFMGQ